MKVEVFSVFAFLLLLFGGSDVGVAQAPPPAPKMHNYMMEAAAKEFNLVNIEKIAQSNNYGDISSVTRRMTRVQAINEMQHVDRTIGAYISEIASCDAYFSPELYEKVVRPFIDVDPMSKAIYENRNVIRANYNEYMAFLGKLKGNMTANTYQNLLRQGDLSAKFWDREVELNFNLKKNEVNKIWMACYEVGMDFEARKVFTYDMQIKALKSLGG